MSVIDLSNVVRTELEAVRKELVGDIEAVVKRVLDERRDSLMTRKELAAYLNTTTVALATRFCRARKAGGVDPLESIKLEINGTERWRRADVEALLARSGAR